MLCYSQKHTTAAISPPPFQACATKRSGCCWCSLPPSYTPEAMKPTPGRVQSPAEGGLACASCYHSIYSSRSLLLPTGASPQLQLTPPRVGLSLPVWVTLSPLTAGTCCHCPVPFSGHQFCTCPLHTQANYFRRVGRPPRECRQLQEHQQSHPSRSQTPARPHEEWAPNSVTGNDKAVPQPEGAGGRRSNRVGRAQESVSEQLGPHDRLSSLSNPSHWLNQFFQ